MSCITTAKKWGSCEVSHAGILVTTGKKDESICGVFSNCSCLQPLTFSITFMQFNLLYFSGIIVLFIRFIAAGRICHNVEASR